MAKVELSERRLSTPRITGFAGINNRAIFDRADILPKIGHCSRQCGGRRDAPFSQGDNVPALRSLILAMIII
jgi:hypothetical protein